MKITIPFINQNGNIANMWESAYANEKSTSSGVYPISNRQVWHTGIHQKGLDGTGFIKPIVLGEIIAFRLIKEYLYFPISNQSEITESKDEITKKINAAKDNRVTVYNTCLTALNVTTAAAAADKLKSQTPPLSLTEDQWTAVSKVLRPYSNAFVLTKHTVKTGNDTVNYFILYNNLAPLDEYKPENEVYKCFFREWKLQYNKIEKGNVAKVNLYNSRELTGAPAGYLDTTGKYDVVQEGSEYADDAFKHVYKIKPSNTSDSLLYCNIPPTSNFFKMVRTKIGLSEVEEKGYEIYYKLIKPDTIESLTVYYDEEHIYPKITINANAYPVKLEKSIKYYSVTYNCASYINTLTGNAASTMLSQENVICLNFKSNSQYTYSDYVKQSDCFICYRRNALTYTGGNKYINKIPDTLFMYEKKTDYTLLLNKDGIVHLELVAGFGYLVLHDLNQAKINNGTINFNANDTAQTPTMEHLYFLSLSDISKFTVVSESNKKYKVNQNHTFTFKKYSKKKWNNPSGAALDVKLFLDDMITIKSGYPKGAAGSNALCVMELSRTKTGGSLPGSQQIGFIGESTTPAKSIFSKHDFVELKFPDVGASSISNSNNETKLTTGDGFYLYSEHQPDGDALKRTIFTTETTANSIILLDQKKNFNATNLNKCSYGEDEYRKVQLTLQNGTEPIYGAVKLNCPVSQSYFTAATRAGTGNQDIANGTIYTSIPAGADHFDYIGKQCKEGDSDVHVELFSPRINQLPQNIKNQFSILSTQYTNLQIDKPTLNNQMAQIPSNQTVDFVSNNTLYSSAGNLANQIYSHSLVYEALNKCVIHCPSFWEYKETGNITPSAYGYPVTIAANDERYRTFIQKNLCINDAVRTKMGVGTQKDYYFFHPFRFLEKVADVLDPIFNPYEGNIVIRGFKRQKLRDNPGFAPIGIENDYTYNHSTGLKKFAKITGGFNESYVNLDTYFYRRTVFCHEGIDFRASLGTDIMCFINGTIISYGHMENYGFTMLIKDTDPDKPNILYLLAHLSDIGTKPGGGTFAENDTVKPGDIVAKAGNSGPGYNQTNYPKHLHLGIVDTNKSQKDDIVFELVSTNTIPTYSWQLDKPGDKYRDGFEHDSGKSDKTVERRDS